MDEWINVSIKQGIEIEKRERPKEEKKKDRGLSFDPHIRREEDYQRGAHHDRKDNACTVSTSRCSIQSLRKVF